MAETEAKNKNQESEDSKIFPQKLMEILEDTTNNDAIAWRPNGKGFSILDRKKFCQDVLPKYFRQSKYTSFTRKLNRWYFTRLSRGDQVSTYYHEHFQRGKDSLCTQMYCNNKRAKFAATSKTSKTSICKPLPANSYLREDLKAATARMQTQNHFTEKDLIKIALVGKSSAIPRQITSRESHGEALFYQNAALARLEQEANLLRLRLAIMKHQKLSGGQMFNCSAA